MEYAETDYLKFIESLPDAVYNFHEKKERKLPMHNHSKAQLSYVEGGIAYISIEERTFVIPARHFIWIPIGITHRLETRIDATAIRSIYFGIEEGIDNDQFYKTMGIYPVTRLLHEMISFTDNFPNQIVPSDSDYTFLVSIKNILPRISKISLPFILPTTRDKRLRPIINYLIQNLSQEITLELLSDQFFMSKRSISRLFQKEMSISFLQYLRQIRIIKAIELMLQSGLNLSEIAYETGYKSLTAFSNTFYQIMRMRPSEFNRNEKN